MTAMGKTNWAIILLSLLVRLVVTDDDNMFIYPTAPGPSDNFVADPVWEIGSVQRISWTTTLDSYYIALFHQQINPGSGIQIKTVYTLNSNGSGDQYFDWTVDTYDTNVTSSPAFFFWINPGGSDGFTSHYFNVTKETSSASATTSTESSSATSASAVASSKAAATTSADPASSSTPAATTSNLDSDSNSNTSSDSSSTAIEVGLGVGLGVGVPLVLIAGIWIGLKAVKQRRSSQRSVGSSTSLAQLSDHKRRPEPEIYPGEPMYRPWEIYEAPAARSPVELPEDKFGR